jgi:DNA mismatch repair protein MutL
MVKNPKITNIIIEAYGQLIPLNRYPIVFINIMVDPSLIDVNIHPTKQEIKFSEEDRLLELIKSTIQSKLELVEVIQPIHKPDAFTPKGQTEMELTPEVRTTSYEDIFYKSIEQEKTIDETDTLYEETTLLKHKVPSLEYIGQYHGTFLLFQNETGLFLLDQHAGAERIRYERYLKRMSSPEKNEYQLLVPMKIELSSSEVIQLHQYLPEIEKFGIIIKNDTESSFIITQIPAWFPRGYEVIYTEAVLMTFIEEKALSVEMIRDELAKLLSCKHSLKANAYISKFEAEQLLHDLYSCENPYTCPHGRPILVHMDQYEIDKWFKRVL